MNRPEPGSRLKLASSELGILGTSSLVQRWPSGETAKPSFTSGALKRRAGSFSLGSSRAISIGMLVVPIGLQFSPSLLSQTFGRTLRTQRRNLLWTGSQAGAERVWRVFDGSGLRRTAPRFTGR